MGEREAAEREEGEGEKRERKEGKKRRSSDLTGKVFKGLKRSMINYPLKNWLKKAGITKPITFHGFRHSYAVIQISLGTDIYTVSKKIGRAHV